MSNVPQPNFETPGDSVDMELSRSDEEQDDRELNQHPSTRLSGYSQTSPSYDRNSESNLETSKSSKTVTDDMITTIVRVTNIAGQASKDQLHTLFSHLGEIANIQLYTYNSKGDDKICFIQYLDPESVLMALYLSNTVFFDKPLVVLPYNRHKIPDIDTARDELSNLDVVTNYNYARHSKHQSRSDRNRDRLRDLDRSERYSSGRRDSPRESRSHGSGRSRDRDLVSKRQKSRSRDRASRRSRSKDRSTRRRSRSRDSSRRKRSRSKEGSRSSRHHKSSRR